MLARRESNHVLYDDVQSEELSGLLDIRRLVLAGLASTAAMTFITYVGPMVGLANVDVAGMLGAMLTGEVPRMFSLTWWSGMTWHFINGAILFPLVFVYAFLPGRRPTTDKARVIRGIAWGVTLWVLLQVLVLPMMGGGFFARNTLHPGLVVFGSFLSHVGYGATLGSIARLRQARFIEITQARAA